MYRSSDKRARGEVRVMTSSFNDKGWAAVLDRPAEISRSEIIILKMKVSTDDENDPEYD